MEKQPSSLPDEVGKIQSNPELQDIAPRNYNFSEIDDLATLLPGDRVEFAHSGELDQFESLLISAKLPSARQDHPAWQYRQPLSQAIKPLKF